MLTREPHEMLNSDFHETLYTYRLRKKMNLENINCDVKTPFKEVKLPLICKYI